MFRGAGEPLDQIWRPNVSAALAYAHSRTGDIAFAVRTPGRFYGYRADHVEWSASVVKAMLMVAYLRASGTVTETDLDPVTHKATCEFGANWLAHVASH